MRRTVALSRALTWSFVVVLQCCVKMWLVRGSRRGEGQNNMQISDEKGKSNKIPKIAFFRTVLENFNTISCAGRPNLRPTDFDTGGNDR